MPEELITLQEWANVDDDDPDTTLAVVFTDIVDSTNLMRAKKDPGMFVLLVSHFAAARRLKRLHKGYEIKLIGDSYMAAFRTAGRAMRFALDFGGDTGHAEVKIRAGINSGQVRIRENDVYGLMVNLASRLCHIKVPRFPDSIFISAAAKDGIDSDFGTDHPAFRIISRREMNIPSFEGKEVFHVIPLPRVPPPTVIPPRGLGSPPKQIEPRVTLPDPPDFKIPPRRR